MVSQRTLTHKTVFSSVMHIPNDHRGDMNELEPIFLALFILMSIRKIYNHPKVVETTKYPASLPFLDINRIPKI